MPVNSKDSLSKYKKKLESMRTKGLGTGKVLIPKDEFTKEDLLNTYGFKESKISIGEKGEVSSVSYRHPTTGHHIHNHRNY